MRMRKGIGIGRSTWLLSLVLLAAGPAAMAQAVYGTIYGTVTDNTGAAVPKATVTVTDTAKGTSSTVTTNDSGEFSAEHLIPDLYNVRVETQGFKAFQQQNIQVFADTSVKVSAALEVGSTGETVNVEADAVPLLKTDRADVATEISAQQVSELPIPDRNFTNLQLLLPGAQQLGWGHAASENPQGSKQIEVDGQAFAGVNYQLDGTDNQDPILGIIVINPNVDSLSEAKITTQNFDAEFGKAVSSVVTVQTKSGTNSFHGSAFDYRESNANLARDPFSQGPGSFFPSGLRNQFGGSIGGPILKNKAFFFGDYQGVRQKVGISQVQTVPTNRLFDSCLGTQTPVVNGVSTPGCDFSDYAAISNIYDNSTAGGGRQFAGNVIPAARVSPQFINFLKVLSPYRTNAAGTVTQGLSGIRNNYQTGGNGSLNSDQWDVRGDYQVSQNMHAFGRFSRFSDILAGSSVLGAAGGKGLGLNGYSGRSNGANDSAAAGVDVALNAKLTFDVRLGYFRYNIVTHKYNEGTNFMTNLGIPGENLGDIITSGAGGFSLQDPGTYGNGDDSSGSVYGQALGWTHCNCPLIEREDQFQLATNWTRILGNHSVKFGVDLRYARNLRVPSDTDRTGVNRFGTGPTGNGQASTGLSFATFALGEVTQFGRYFSTSTNAKEFQKRFFGYAQDTWRARQNLTVNYGLRYEAYFPETINQSGGGSLLNLDTGYLQVAGVGSVASNMNIGLPKYAFNPRLGVNYEIKPGTVIRAGYGRSFDIGVFGSIFGHAATQNLPVLSSQQLNPAGDGNPQSKQFVFSLASGPPAAAAVSTPGNGLLPNPGAVVNSHARPTTERLPTLDAWNAALQQSLSNDWSMTLAYVANKGTHTLGDQSGQQTNPNEPGDVLPAQYSITGQTLHWDPTVTGNTISSTGGTANGDYLRRYYGAKLPACSDALYNSVGGKAGVNPLTGASVAGSCGWNSDIQYYEDGLDTHYNSMQVTLAKQMTHGYSLNINYAWQQAISEATGYSTWSRPVVRGRDGALRQQQVIVYGVLQLPFGHGKKFLNSSNGIINQIVSGYEVNPVITYSSGLPFTLSYGSSNNPCNQNVGGAPCYLVGDAHGFHPQVTGSPNAGLSFYPAFTGKGTLSAPGYEQFGLPGVLQFGNVGRNTAFGPHFFNTDLSIQKSFAIRESVSFILRADGYNAFNHINWGTPGGNIENGGGISSGPFPNSSANPRQLQFSGRVQF